MSTHKKYIKASIFAFLCLALSVPAISRAEGLYLRPRAGVAAPITGGDPYYSVGATVGYQWIRLFSTEVSYTRLLGYGNAGDGNTFRGEGVFSVPVGIVTPFASLGAGYLTFDGSSQDSHFMTIFGGGLSLSKIFFLSASLGVDYAIVPNAGDFIEPYVAIGFSF